MIGKLFSFFSFYNQFAVNNSSVFFLFISDPPLSCLSEYATVGPHSDSGNSTGTGNPNTHLLFLFEVVILYISSENKFTYFYPTL